MFTVIVVCMNPSKADIEISDKTVNRAIEYAKKERYDGYYILNVYPKYGTSSCEILENSEGISNTLLNENYEPIKKVLIKTKPTKVFLAYGDMNGCKKIKNDMLESAKKILNLLKEYKISAKRFGKPTIKGNPRHLSRISDENLYEENIAN